MMQNTLHAQAFFPKEALFMTCTRVKGGRRSTRPDFSHTLPCALRLPSGDCVQVYYPAMCSGLFSALSQIPLIIWNRPVQHRLVAFLVQGPLMSVGACKRLPGFNLSLTTQLSEPPAPFLPPFFLIVLLCLPSQEARTELPQDEAGPVQRSVWHQRAIGWVACQQPCFLAKCCRLVLQRFGARERQRTQAWWWENLVYPELLESFWFHDDLPLQIDQQPKQTSLTSLVLLRSHFLFFFLLYLPAFCIFFVGQYTTYKVKTAECEEEPRWGREEEAWEAQAGPDQKNRRQKNKTKARRQKDSEPAR